MKTIDKYILTEFFRIFLLAFITLLCFYEMVVFLDMAGYFMKFKATPDMIFRYMMFKAPMGLFHVTPICVLLASLLTMGTMSRYSEITAMKSCGMSMVRIATPILIACMGISLISFLDSEYMFYIAARESNRIYYEEIKKQPRKGLFSHDRIWYKADDGSIWNIGGIAQDRKNLLDISVFMFDKSGDRMISRVTASGAKLMDGHWMMENYVERTFPGRGMFEEKRLDTKVFKSELIPIEDLGKVELDPEEMNLAQMSAYIKDLRDKGYDATKYVIDMHSKIGFPLISLIMPLLAIPMGTRSSRAGGALVGIGVAVVIGALFWFVFSMGLAFGKAGRLPPMLAVYGAHALFASWGLFMLLSRRQ